MYPNDKGKIDKSIENKDNEFSRELKNLRTSIQQHTEIPDALRVITKPLPRKDLRRTTIISGEFFGEKKGGAPGESISGESLIFKYGKEVNYLNIYRKMSYNDYKQLFNNFSEVKQGFFGDCYLISTLKSLARCKYFDTLMMTSIQKNKDGSFNLFLPLGQHNQKKIHISKEELSLAKIKGSDGYKILEVGFAKEILLRKNGSGLYNGEMPDIKLTKETMNQIIGGNSYNALAVLLGYNNVKRQLINNTPQRKNLILKELQNFDPKNLKIITLSSRRRPKNIPSTEKTYTIFGQKMYYHHAYSVYAIEKRGNQIESVILEDPTNNKNKIKLPLLSFMNAFFSITTCSPKEGFLSIF